MASPHFFQNQFTIFAPISQNLFSLILGQSPCTMKRYPGSNPVILKYCPLCSGKFHHGISSYCFCSKFQNSINKRFLPLIISITAYLRYLENIVPEWFTERTQIEVSYIHKHLFNIELPGNIYVSRCSVCNKRIPEIYPTKHITPRYFSSNLFILSFALTINRSIIIPQANYIRLSVERIYRSLNLSSCSNCKFPVAKLTKYQNQTLCNYCYKFYSGRQLPTVYSGYFINRLGLIYPIPPL